MGELVQNFQLVAEKPDHDEGKLHRLLEGTSNIFPGNGSLSQYFSAGLTDGRIQPEKVALIYDEKKVTFAELEEISDRIAEVIRDTVKNFRNQNPDQDSVIAICIPPSTKLIFIMLAIYKIGAAYVPIDPSFPEDRVFKIVKDCRPLLIISDHHSNILSKFDIVRELSKVMTTVDLIKQAESRTSQLDAKSSPTQPPENSGSDLDQQPKDADSNTEVQPDEVERVSATNSVNKTGKEVLPGTPVLAERTAIILYTSGSSGEPKGVRLNHRTVMNRLSWQWHEFPYADGEVCVFKTSLTFVDSVPEIFSPLLQGLTLVIFDKHTTSQPNVFIERLGYHKITRVTLVPSLLRAIFRTINISGVSAGVNLLSCVKLWICSGEPLHYDLVSEFFEIYPRRHTLANFYGSTEMMGDVTYVSYSSREDAYRKALDKKVPIGVPIYNTVVYVLDNNMYMTEFGEIGEIYVAGYNLATNYVGGANPEKFVENSYTRTAAFKTLYRTGDYGKIDKTQDGTRMLFYEGRVDSQIKVRGQRIDLAEVELALSEIHLISKAVVICHKPGEEDQTVLAYVVPTDPAVTLERLEPMLEKRLRDYERPLIKFVKEIPVLVNGKTDRQRLLKMHEKELARKEEFEDWTSLDLPADKIPEAKIVLKMMSQVSGSSVETLAENIDNSFFNVGGTSLNAVLVVVKLRQFNIFISVADFANAKTIRHIILSATRMSKEEDTEDAAEEGDGMEEEFSTGLLKSDSPATQAISSRYNITQLTDEDREEAVHTISYSFSKKGDLEAYTKATYEEFQVMINSIWKDIVGKGHSIIVRRNKDQKCVGVSFNFDIYDEPEHIQASQSISYSLTLLEFIESRQRLKLPKGRGKLLHSFMMGTPDDVDEAESVAVIEAMESYILQLATSKKFMGVITTNTNPLTKQLDLDIHGYEVLNEYQANKYTAPDGTKPFLLAPDSFKIVCCWKQIPGNQMDMF